MKYDCYKALDLIHEYRRLCCDFHSAGCENDCPFCDMGNCGLDFFDEDKIALLQKWSDEHPELPKLTRKERNFIASFCSLDVSIERHSGIRLFVTQHSPVYSTNDINAIPIDSNMFPFIHDGEEWGLDKLLRLEVEE